MECLDHNELAGFIDGSLDAPLRAEMEAHLADCAMCRQVIARVAGDDATGEKSAIQEHGTSSSSDGFKQGALLGRFVLLELVGQGGMGVVYAAYDPQVNRKVALKLLRQRTAGPDPRLLRARMIREAQALGRISHPNVIPIYEVGTFDDQVFLVMEFLEGGTLRDWLDGQPRHWREVLDQFFYAGRGLAAAHEAGLTHRDFKPENVLLRKDGRICVSDFGLARQVDQPTSSQESQALSPDSPLTETGTVVGTPGYMAPEQLMGHLSDSRADQFSFCVALYQALYGERPFEGSTPAELLEAMRANRVRPAPPSSQVPSRVRRVLLRGLSLEVSARFASMNELLRALKPKPWAGWKRVALASAAMLICAAAGGGYAIRSRHVMCRGAERKLGGVWDEARKQSIATAFRATKLPFAEDAWRAVRAAFDLYAKDWVTMHTEACEATRIRGEQSDGLLGLRMDCLDTRLKELDALGRAYAHADAKIVERAGQTAHSLVELDLCANVIALKAKNQAVDERIRQKVQVLKEKVVQGKTLGVVGKYEEAIAVLEPAIAEIKSVGYRPLLASALTELGVVQGNSGKTKKADQTFRAAIQQAQSVGAELPKANALMNLATQIAVDEGRPNEAGVLLEIATATVEELGNPPTLKARLELNLGTLSWVEHRFDEALPHHQASLEINEKQKDLAAAAMNLHDIASCLEGKGDLKAAIDAYQRELSQWKSVVGDGHPMVALNHLGMASTRWRLGQVREGITSARAAIAVLDHLKSAPPRWKGAVFEVLAVLQLRNGEIDLALSSLRQMKSALALSTGTNPKDQSELNADFGKAYRLRHDYAKAKTFLTKAIHLVEGFSGNNISQTLADNYHERGNLALDERRFSEALGFQQKALPLLTEVNGPDSQDRAKALQGIGEAQLGLHRADLAVQSLESALRIRQTHQGDPMDLARTKLSLAEALWSFPAKRARAASLAGEAASDLQSAEPAPPVREALAAVEIWRAKHQRGGEQLSER